MVVILLILALTLTLTLTLGTSNEKCPSSSTYLCFPRLSLGADVALGLGLRFGFGLGFGVDLGSGLELGHAHPGTFVVRDRHWRRDRIQFQLGQTPQRGEHCDTRGADDPLIRSTAAVGGEFREAGGTAEGKRDGAYFEGWG